MAYTRVRHKPKSYYQTLWMLMTAKSIRREEIAIELGKSLDYVSKRFVGKKSWTIEECYKILDILGVDSSQLTYVFTKDPHDMFTPKFLFDQEELRR